MSHRTAAAAAVAVALVAALAGTAAAQESRAVVSKMQLSTASVPISDDAITALVAEHFADALHGAQASQITLVVDANGKYVNGTSRKMTIISKTEMPDGVYTDSSSSGTNVMIRRTQTGDATAAAAGTVAFMRSENGDVAHGFMGIEGVTPQDVGSVGMKRFAAGTMGDADIMVMVVKLK